jgi:iron complex transport system substrate-binding protein
MVSTDSRQRICDAAEVLVVGGNSKPQQIDVPIEAPAPDALSRELFMQCVRIAVPDQPEQCRAADDVAATFPKDGVKSGSFPFQAHTRACRPAVVAQGGGADRQGWPGNRPGAERLPDLSRNAGRRNCKAKSKAGQAVEFSKRTQDNNWQVGAQCRRRQLGFDIDEGLIDDKPAAAVTQGTGGICDDVERRRTSVRIVGVHDHGVTDARADVPDVIARRDVAPAVRPGISMLAVGGADDRHCAGSSQMRQPLDQRLCAGGDRDVDARRDMIRCARGVQQRDFVGCGRKAVQGRCEMLLRHGPWHGIDAGGQIKPRRQRPAVARNRFAQIAAMLHGPLLPLFSSAREWLARAAFVAVAMVAAAPSAASAQQPQPRIASINVCTDQLVLALADPQQIAGLSPYSRDAVRSWSATRAAQFPKLSGEAEDVLILKPDVVVAGRFTKRATRELLKDKGLRVIEFDAARSLDDVRSQIRRMGDIVGHPERAAVEIAKLDAAVARLRTQVKGRSYEVLALSRRGWVSGSDSLTTAMLAEVGLSNAAPAFGLRLGGFASLEAIINLKPDLILLSEGGDRAEDQGRAFLLHPALERLYPPAKRIIISERLTVCGGPMLVEALEHLAAELARLRR